MYHSGKTDLVFPLKWENPHSEQQYLKKPYLLVIRLAVYCLTNPEQVPQVEQEAESVGVPAAELVPHRRVDDLQRPGQPCQEMVVGSCDRVNSTWAGIHTGF